MITIYTFPECPYCNTLKEYYIKENIEYKEVNVELKENEKEWKKISELSKSDMVPLIKVNKQLLVANVSFKTIEEAVEVTKKFLE
jgi:glutaredoxin